MTSLNMNACYLWVGVQNPRVRTTKGSHELILHIKFVYILLTGSIYEKNNWSIGLDWQRQGHSG
jgi:hypothetical protein